MAARRAEGHADPNLARALHHQICQHAVNPQRCEQRRQSSECHRETGDHALREEILVHHPANRLQLVYGEVRVRLPDGVPQFVRDQQGVLLAPHVKAHSEQLSELRIGKEEIRTVRCSDMIFFGILHHADDFDVRLGSGTSSQREMHADRVSLRKKSLHHRFIDNRHFCARRRVSGVELASREQRYSHR